MTAFDVNHNGYLEVNEQLYQHVGTLGTIINDLNQALRNIPDASRGQSTPIWLEHQTRWNAAYEDMTQRINATTVSSVNVHEMFKGGDNTGARIMLG
jgi:uncharacterized protein YukE